jgi:hypothetical protein
MKDKPSITWTHDWVSVKFGNNRSLSCSYGGSKASGAVPQAVFDLWYKTVDLGEPAALALIGLNKTPKQTKKEVVSAFVDKIADIWPEWNKPPVVPAVGSPISFDFGKRRGGIDTGTVEKVRGTMVTVRFVRNGLIGMPADMLS